MSKSFEERFAESAAIAGEGRETARQEYAMRTKILDLLRAGPKTVPEVARALGVEPHRAMWWMMGYVRYGFVRATDQVSEDGYCAYELTEGK